MPDSVLIDTDVLIDAARGMSAALAYLKRIEEQEQASISIITEMELIVGCRNKRELRALERFLAHFRVIPVNPQISSTAVELLRQYRLSHGLLIADALIAATALFLEIPLLTKNQSDYRFVSGLQLLPYPES
ncbi:MAG: type II toxin-antitoxin system VapC family toxin [Anaerolineae bacterium]